MNVQLTAESGDAAKSLMELVASSAADINAHPRLVSSGYSVSTELMTAPMQASWNDTSKYRFLKEGDRDTLENGITICFLPLTAKEEEDASDWEVSADLRVDICCYVKGCTNPQKQHDSLYGIIQAVASVLNTRDNFALSLPGKAAVMCRAFSRDFVLAIKSKGGEEVPTALLSWRGKAYYQT